MNPIYIAIAAFLVGAIADATLHRLFIIRKLNADIRNLELARNEMRIRLELAGDDIRRYELRLLELSKIEVGNGAKALKHIKAWARGRQP